MIQHLTTAALAAFSAFVSTSAVSGVVVDPCEDVPPSSICEAVLADDAPFSQGGYIDTAFPDDWDVLYTVFATSGNCAFSRDVQVPVDPGNPGAGTTSESVACDGKDCQMVAEISVFVPAGTAKVCTWFAAPNSITGCTEECTDLRCCYTLGQNEDRVDLEITKDIPCGGSFKRAYTFFVPAATCTGGYSSMGGLQISATCENCGASDASNE